MFKRFLLDIGETRDGIECWHINEYTDTPNKFGIPLSSKIGGFFVMPCFLFREIKLIANITIIMNAENVEFVYS